MDSTPSLRAFAAGLGGVGYPLLSDFHPKGAVLQQLDLYNEERGNARRSASLIDKEGVVRWHRVYQPGTLPDPDEALTELDKLQT